MGTEAAKTELATGMAITPGVAVTTGDRSRVMLQRGTESMVIGPHSIVAVSEHPSEGLSTTVVEKAGTVAFNVEKQNVQYFSVETPMLAAVVKGTHFTVVVGQADGRVSVARGTVQVTSLRVRPIRVQHVEKRSVTFFVKAVRFDNHSYPYRTDT